MNNLPNIGCFAGVLLVIDDRFGSAVRVCALVGALRTGEYELTFLKLKV